MKIPVIAFIPHCPISFNERSGNVFDWCARCHLTIFSTDRRPLILISPSRSRGMQLGRHGAELSLAGTKKKKTTFLFNLMGIPSSLDGKMQMK